MSGTSEGQQIPATRNRVRVDVSSPPAFSRAISAVVEALTAAIEALEASNQEVQPEPEFEEVPEASFDESMVSLDTAGKASGSGLFGRIKNRFFGSRADGDGSQTEAGEDEAPAAAFDEVEGGALDEEGDQRPPHRF